MGLVVTAETESRKARKTASPPQVSSGVTLAALVNFFSQLEEAVLICKSRTGSAHFAHPHIILPHTHTHTITLMSSESLNSRPNVSFSRFQDLFEAALVQYSQKTGKDIATDPLTARLLPCGSSDKVLDILQEQAHAFNQYRNGDWKIQLMKRLRPMVDVLFGLSTSGVFGEGIGQVRMTKLTYYSCSTFTCRAFHQRRRYLLVSASYSQYVSPCLVACTCSLDIRIL
jgi:hypothetical protein